MGPRQTQAEGEFNGVKSKYVLTFDYNILMIKVEMPI